MADQHEDMPGASEVKHLEHDQPVPQPAEEVDDERRGTPAQAPEQPAQQAPPAKEQLLSASPQASAPMADQHKDMPGASEVKHLEHDQPVAQPAEEVDDERRGTPAQAPEQPAQEALPAKEQILSTSPQASAPMADQHEDMPGASEVKHLEHDQPGTPPAEEVDDERLGTPAQAPEQPAQQAASPGNEQGGAPSSTSKTQALPAEQSGEQQPQAGPAETASSQHSAVAKTTARSRTTSRRGLPDFDEEFSIYLWNRIQRSPSPSPASSDEEFFQPARRPVTRGAQQAASWGDGDGGPPSQQAASPGDEASMADQHQDMPGASEVKHLEHDQNGTPPAEEVDDERRGTPAQAPEQPAQQALPAKEQILSTSPQASAPMADQHQDMPGASERKHLEHDQPCIPPHTSKQSARPAEQVVDEHLSAARGKGKGQGNKRQFAANGSTDIVGPEFKKNKTAFLVPNEQCRACDSNQEESMDSKNEESSEQPKSSSHEDLSHTTSRQSSNDSLQLPEASGSQPQRSSSGEDDETMVKCMMLTNDHWEQWLHSGGKWLLRTYAISKLPHTLHIIVSVKGGQQFLYVGSIVIVDCLEVPKYQKFQVHQPQDPRDTKSREFQSLCKIYIYMCVCVHVGM